MAVNFIFIIIGLTICFGGIYFRRFFSGIIGFVWGALLSVGLILLAVGTRKFDLQEYIVPVLVVGIVLGIASAVYYRICALVNGFVTGAFIAFIVAALANDFEATAGVIIIALILGVISAMLSFKFYDYSFILLTAFLGGVIASVVIYGLLSGSDIEEIAFEIMWSSKNSVIILLLTLVLTVIGSAFQIRRLKAINKNTANDSRYVGAKSFIHTFRVIRERISTCLHQLASFLPRIRKELTEEKELIFAPLFSFVIIPLIYSLLGTNYGSNWYSAASWLNIIATSITLAALVFFVQYRTKAFVFCVVAFYSIFSIIFNISNFSYLNHNYSFWYVLLLILKYPIYTLILLLTSNIIKRKSIQPIVLSCVVFLLNEFVYDWIMSGSINVHISFYTFVRAFLQLAAIYFIFKTRNNINVFSFAVSDGDDKQYLEIQKTNGISKRDSKLFVILAILSIIVIVSFALAPSFQRTTSHRVELQETDSDASTNDLAQRHRSTSSRVTESSYAETDRNASSDDQSKQDDKSTLTPLKDGIYNVLLYEDKYEATEKGTYATVDIEDYVSFSDVYVKSLKPGDTFRDEIIESIESYDTMIRINDIWALLKYDSSHWRLYGPFGDSIMEITEYDVPVFFPAGAPYYTYISPGIGADEYQIDRIEDYFEVVELAYSVVVVTITVENQTITEAHIFFKS